MRRQPTSIQSCLRLLLLLLFVTRITNAHGATVSYELHVAESWRNNDCYSRPSYSINSISPGPTLYVRTGDILSVLVCNDLMDIGLSIHWHGLHQRGTPYLDGVSDVTQCPIASSTCMNYTMPIGDQAGSFIYHAHHAALLADGVYGAIVIYDALPTGSNQASGNAAVQDTFFGFPLVSSGFLPASTASSRPSSTPVYRELTWILSDWFHDHSSVLVSGLYGKDAAFKWVSEPNALLLNGKGSYCNDLKVGSNPSRNNFATECAQAPASLYNTNPTCGYPIVEASCQDNLLVHVINAASLTYLSLRIANYSMEIIGTDGMPAVDQLPIGSRSSLEINSGERYDILLKRNADAGPCSKFNRIEMTGMYRQNQPTLYGVLSFPDADTSTSSLPSSTTCPMPLTSSEALFPQALTNPAPSLQSVPLNTIRLQSMGENNVARNRSISATPTTTAYTNPTATPQPSVSILMVGRQERQQGIMKWTMNRVANMQPPTPAYFSSILKQYDSLPVYPAAASASNLSPPSVASMSTTLTWTAQADIFSGASSSAGASGTVTFNQYNGGPIIGINITLRNFRLGTYAMHIHTYGDMSSSFPINSAIVGGHFNPTNADHSCYPNPNRHVGDIGNIVVTASPQYIYLERDLLTLVPASSTAETIIGRSVIFHSAAENCLPPTGSAGAPMAQGVIGISPPATGLSQQASANLQNTPASAYALMRPTAAFNAAKGEVQFIPDAQSGLIRVNARFSGLVAFSNHSMHVHSYGAYSSDGSAAGGHFNPSNAPHALPPITPRHMGDLGNFITADANGQAFATGLFDLLSLTASTGNIIGRSVVLHALIDDGTGASGNAGSRMMVGVIGVSAVSTPLTAYSTVSSSSPATPPLGAWSFDRETVQWDSAGVLSIELGTTVELIIQNTFALNGVCEQHPWHLHGQHFIVHAMGSGNYDPTIPLEQQKGLVASSLGRDLGKDSFTLYPRLDDPQAGVSFPFRGTPQDGCGWASIRFTADNPGIWLMHCHVLWHSVMGMSVALHVKHSNGSLPTLPIDTNICGEPTLLYRNVTTLQTLLPHLLQTQTQQPNNTVDLPVTSTTTLSWYDYIGPFFAVVAVLVTTCHS